MAGGLWSNLFGPSSDDPTKPDNGGLGGLGGWQGNLDAMSPTMLAAGLQLMGNRRNNPTEGLPAIVMKGSADMAKEADKTKSVAAAKAALIAAGMSPEQAESVSKSPEMSASIAQGVLAKKLLPDEGQVVTRPDTGETVRLFKDNRTQPLFGAAPPTYDIQTVEREGGGQDVYAINKKAATAKPIITAPSGQGTVESFNANADPAGVTGPKPIPPNLTGKTAQAAINNSIKNFQDSQNPTTEARNDLRKAERAAADLKSEIPVLREMVKTHGAAYIPDKVKAQMGTVFTQIQMKLKDLHALGALAGPDLSVIGGIITDPRGNPLNPMDWGKAIYQRNLTEGQLDALEGVIDRGLENVRTTHGVRPSPSTPAPSAGNTASGTTYGDIVPGSQKAIPIDPARKAALEAAARARGLLK